MIYRPARGREEVIVIPLEYKHYGYEVSSAGAFLVLSCFCLLQERL